MKKGMTTPSDDIPKIYITGIDFDGIKDVCEDEFDNFLDELEKIRRSNSINYYVWSIWIFN